MLSRERRLGDVADVSWGDTKTTKASYVPEGYRAYSAKGQDGYLPHFDYSEPGVVVSAIGAQCGKVWYANGNWSCIKNTIRILARPGVSDARYLFYAASEPGFFPNRGSAQPFIAQSDARNIRIHLPPLDEQRRIAGVLGALDDLIEVNRGLIADLDAALSTSWKMAASRDSLPIAFGEVAVAGKGLSYKGAYLTDKGIPMINMGSFGVDGNYREDGLKWYLEEEVKAKHRLVQGDLVIVNTDLTQSRDILARPVVVPFEHATSTHHTYQVKVPGGEAQRFWIYCALRQESVRQRLISYATGTTVAALPLDALTSQEIPWSEPLAIENWWKDTEPLYSSQIQLRNEIQDLIQARDELLPLLMSGRVRVREDEVAA